MSEVAITNKMLSELIDVADFTDAEMREITDVNPFQFKNWRKRGHLDVGTLQRTKRWLYSMRDMIAIGVMEELVCKASLSPKYGARVVAGANELIDVLLAEGARQPESIFPEGLLPQQLANCKLLMFLADGDLLSMDVVLEDDFGAIERCAKGANVSEVLHKLDLTHLRFALGTIVHTVVLEAFDSLNNRDEE